MAPSPCLPHSEPWTARRSDSTAKHRQDEFIAFLDCTAAQFPDQEVHANLNKYSTHKVQGVHEWLASRPNCAVHFTPASSFWLNAVQDVSAKLSRRRLKLAIFRSLQECQAAILLFTEEHNATQDHFECRSRQDHSRPK